MSQAGFTLSVIFAGFLVFIVAKGRAPTYLSIFGL